MPQERTVIRPSLIRNVRLFLFSACGMAVGLVAVCGLGVFVWTPAGLVVTLAFALVVVSIGLVVPRVEITDEGFMVLTASGVRFYRWADIDGDFATHTVGLMTLVVFNLTPAYKSANTPRRPPVPGCDDAITGSFKLSMPELADLLNRRKNAVAPSRAPG